MPDDDAQRALLRERFERAIEQLDADTVEGYNDGRNSDQVAPGENRSPCYKHGWEVGRADRERRPAFGSAMMARVKCSEARTAQMAELGL
jgi:hypothetical protein